MSKKLVGNFMLEILCWVFYYVNDGSKVNVNVPQLMHFVVYYDSPVSFAIFNERTRLRNA
jgi:hypothetical protein